MDHSQKFPAFSTNKMMYGNNVDLTWYIVIFHANGNIFLGDKHVISSPGNLLQLAMDFITIFNMLNPRTQWAMESI